MTWFVALTALALLLQAGVLLAIFLTLRRMSEATRGLQRRMEEQVSPILDNVDEITTTASTQVASLDKGKISRFEISPEDVGIERVSLQELLGGFLLGGLVEVTWPRGDVPYRPDGVHLMTIRYEMSYGPDMEPDPRVRRVNVPVKTPPQEAVSRDEWLQAFRAFGEQDRRM
ncbi:MAG: hypothetical protein IH789_06985, partial [Acidobacteria bacterium]|nr:hypothetical protein [Acidobacteriota bacterium]